MCSMSICCGHGVTGCGTIVMLLHRTKGTWAVRPSHAIAYGRTFQDCYDDVLLSLGAIFDPVLLAERRASMKRTFNMVKADVCELPPDLFMSGEDLFVGLGWNTRCDLDAGIMLVDKDAAEGARAINIVNYRDKTFGKAVIHRGDNVTGEGGGDDERIDIDLDYMPEEVKALWVVVNVFTSGRAFSDVTGAYIRLCAAKNGHVLCQFRLDDDSINSRGLVLAKIFRNAAKRWCVMAVGNSCEGQTANSPETRLACGITGPELSPQEINIIEQKANLLHTTCHVITLSLKGVNLAIKDPTLMGGKSDPYFELWDVTRPEDRFLVARSNIVMNCLNPVWTPLQTEVIPGHKYRITVWDYDRVGPINDFIGSADVGSLENFQTKAPGFRYTLTPPPRAITRHPDGTARSWVYYEEVPLHLHKQMAGEIEIVDIIRHPEMLTNAQVLQARKKRMSSSCTSSDPISISSDPS